MAFSAFHRFHRRFSGADPIAKRIYLALRDGLGPSFDQTFDGNPIQARLYAQAMTLARAARLVERVKNQAIGKRATDLLPALEQLYGLSPLPSATEYERRQRLHIRMLVPRGASTSAIGAILQEIVGDDLLEWFFPSLDDLVRFPDTSAQAAAVGNYVPAGSVSRLLRTTQAVFPSVSEQTVLVEDLRPLVAGEPLAGVSCLIDPAHNVRRESNVIQASTSVGNSITSITAVFANVHDEGALITTQYFPTWRSNGQEHRFSLVEAAARDTATLNILNEELARVMKSTATWEISEPGAFAIGEGLIGITPFGGES
jgi:hypothetical protein